jgi:hypothetical protein
LSCSQNAAPIGNKTFTGAEGWGATLAQLKISKEGNMPQILVTAENPRAHGERAVMFTERVSSSDFESGHFQAQLVERIGWAVGDADALEHERPDCADAPEPPRPHAVEEQPRRESASTRRVLAPSA